MILEEILKEKGLFQYFKNIEDRVLREKLIRKSTFKTYKSEDIMFFNPEDEMAYLFLDGRYQIRSFITDTLDCLYPKCGEFWLGIPSAIGEKVSELEITFIEETRVLALPLKELLYADSAKNIDLWIRITKLITNELAQNHMRASKRLVLPTDVYFLNCLAENNYIYEGLSVQDISYIININTRTLQRVVQNLERDGLIIRSKTKKMIRAADKDLIDKFLEEIY